MARKRTPSCKYYAKRGSKTVANTLAKDLRASGFRARVRKAAGGVAGGFTVLTCGRAKRRRCS